MANRVELTKLFSPIKIGVMELKNRIMLAPMELEFNAPDGYITERTKGYFLRRARGGAALLTAQLATVVPDSQVMPAHEAIWDDKFISQWEELAKAIHDAGSKLSIQLTHGGRECRSRFTGQQPVSPGSIASPATRETPRQLTVAQIEELIEKFGEAARRVREAGADAVEILGAQGQLVHNFMSPLANNRADEYGGNLEGQAKFPVEIIKRVRKKIGSNFPLIFRMVASDLVEGGLTLEDTKTIAPWLVAAGANALHVTAGAGFEVMYLCTPPADFAPGCIVELVGGIKSVVDVPVIAVQRIIDPVQAEQILQAGKADIISLGRALIADPDWPRKAADGALEDIRRCIGCCQGCIDCVPATCLQNPEVGREKEYEIHPAKEPKKVLVIGGGPAGLEVAGVAALRGHQVTLYEKGSELGGQWLVASKAPKKDGFSEVLRYRIGQLNKLRVKIELNKTVTPALIEEVKPDVVVVATGAAPLIPQMPGVDRENVITAHQVLSGKADIGGKVAILGGGMVGCETADFLAERGKKVTIVEMLGKVAKDVGMCRKPPLMQRLTQAGVEILTSTSVKAISDTGIIADRNGVEENIGVFDTIVLALGATSVREIAEQLKGKVSQIYAIGDAVEPRKAIDAIADGARIGREI